MNRRTVLFFYLALLVVPALANTVFAQETVTNQTVLLSALQYAQCKTNFTTSYISQVTTAVPRLSSLSGYSITLKADTTALALFANAGNVTGFRSYLSGTYDKELDTIAANASAQFRAANLSASTIAVLRTDYNSTLVAYRSCGFGSAKAYALNKLEMFNESIVDYQSQASSLSSKGINVSSLNQMLQNAQAQIIIPFATAVNQATNVSQIYAAVSMYCLFDGCKGGTNFHLAAHFGLQSLTLQLNYLESDKNVSASSLVPAQTDLNNASSILQVVGTKVYVNSQGDNIFDNLSAASKAMQQARQQDSFAKVKQGAEKILAQYQATITKDEQNLGKLPKGTDTSQLNATFSQAEALIIAPLQSAINTSTNATQLYNAFRSHCLENSCVNGTDFHLSAKLQVEEGQAYLWYLELKANASSYVVVNATALAEAQDFLNNATSLINTVGPAQFTQVQIEQLAAYMNGFTNALKHAFTVSRSHLTTVNSLNVTARVKGTGAVTTTLPKSTNRNTTAVNGGGKANATATGGNTGRVNASVTVIGKKTNSNTTT